MGEARKIILIGEWDKAESAYEAMCDSDSMFDLVGVVLTGTEMGFMEKSFHEVAIQGKRNIPALQIQQPYAEWIVTSVQEQQIMQELEQLGVEKAKICSPAVLYGTLNKKQTMEWLKKDIDRRFQSKYRTAYIEIGDFSYGKPLVRRWREDTILSIGKFCSISSGVSIFLGGNHRGDWNTTYPFSEFIPAFAGIQGHPFSKGNVEIGNDVWIAADVKILSGVTIGDGCVIGTGAVVTKDIPPYMVAGGVPARVIKPRFDEITRQRLQKMEWWNWPYEMLFDAIPLLQSANYEALWEYYQEKRASSD